MRTFNIVAISCAPEMKPKRAPRRKSAAIKPASNKELSKKTTFICHFKHTDQTHISKDVKAALMERGTYSRENLNFAMDGQLCDLEDLIDITPYLNRELIR